MSQRAAPAEPEGNPPEVEAAYAAVPAGMKAEILDGVFYMMNRPKMPHVRVASRLGMVLGAAFEMGVGGPGGWVFLDEPELHLGRRPDKLGPDLAGWRRERLPPRPEGAMITVPPDWVCEVISESTEEIDRARKWRIYRREAVRHFWIIDPVARTLEVYALEGSAWKLALEAHADEKVHAPPFDALSLDLATLWSW